MALIKLQQEAALLHTL